MSTDLELLRQKKIAELRRKLLESKAKTNAEQAMLQEPKKNPSEIVKESLVGRAVEVLETARRYYPNEIAILEENIVSLIESGRLKGPIGGEELYTFLRRAGLNFSMNTKIRIAEGGKVKSLEEKLRGQSKD